MNAIEQLISDIDSIGEFSEQEKAEMFRDIATQAAEAAAAQALVKAEVARHLGAQQAADHLKAQQRRAARAKGRAQRAARRPTRTKAWKKSR